MHCPQHYMEKSGLASRPSHFTDEKRMPALTGIQSLMGPREVLDAATEKKTHFAGNLTPDTQPTA
jgi:hypothetical protein